MKNLILKWLGLDNVLRSCDSDFIDDCVTSYLSRKYDLDNMSSRLDDLESTVSDGEYRWDSAASEIDDIYVSDLVYKHDIADIKDAIDKVQQLDDRLTELVAGYKLDVQLIKEDF
tara:strand:- start:797 stop:1141 length:345 start_codon:yes stop_codon:yes gene_type:complete